MKLRGEANQQLVIERSDTGPADTPGAEDLLLEVSVQVGGYSVVDHCWVVGRAWTGFLSQLRSLERVRQGQAELRGASADDLHIRFAATDPAGHMSVTGFVGWRAPDGFVQRLEFGFRFDPGVLAQVVREFEELGR